MQKINLLVIATAVLLSTACTRSNDFSPKPEMSGKEIFDVTCTECHSPVGEYLMELDADMKDADRIANHVLTGSMAMPAFPNIQGESAKKLSEYVLKNSKFK